jgi:site-specific DNA-methyltransferase (adenine-specific)
MSIKLIQGDCLDVMARLEAGSVDLTVTSPPYDNLRTYNGSLNDWTPAKWKASIAELYRVTKNGGVVVWVVADATINGSETGTSFRQTLHAVKCGFSIHDTMIYHREGPPLSHNRYEQKFEFMFVWTKGKPSTFNGLREPAIYAGESRASKTMRQDGDHLSSRSAKGVTAKTRLRGNVWKYAVGYNCSAKDKIAHGHPAIFPEALASDHIISWSNPGDTVFDPFLGSGTTGIAALRTGRSFVGVERNKEYFEIALERHRRHIARTSWLEGEQVIDVSRSTPRARIKRSSHVTR